jgi:hypothetical protein
MQGVQTGPRPEDRLSTLHLAEGLPILIENNADQLGYDLVQTYGCGIEVDIRKRHPRPRGVAGLVIHVRYTGAYPNKKRAERVRENFIKLIKCQLDELNLQHISWAIDLCWVPGHGCIKSHGSDVRW